MIRQILIQYPPQVPLVNNSNNSRNYNKVMCKCNKIKQSKWVLAIICNNRASFCSKCKLKIIIKKLTIVLLIIIQIMLMINFLILKMRKNWKDLLTTKIRMKKRGTSQSIIKIKDFLMKYQLQ